MKRFLLYHIMYVIFFKVENRERERLDSYKSNVLDNDDTIGIPAWLRWLTWRLIAMMPYPCWVRAYELIERPELFSYNAHEIARRYWGNECAVSSRVCYSSMAVTLPSLYIYICVCVWELMNLQSLGIESVRNGSQYASAIAGVIVAGAGASVIHPLWQGLGIT